MTATALSAPDPGGRRLQPRALTILKHAANGHTVGWIATATSEPSTLVQTVLEEHGWPDLDQVRDAIADHDAAPPEVQGTAAAGISTTPGYRDPGRVVRPAPTASTGTNVVRNRATPTPPPAPALSADEQLLLAAAKTDPAVQRLIDKLKAKHAVQAKKAAAKAAKEHEKRRAVEARQQALADVDRLTKELNAARVKAGLRPIAARVPRGAGTGTAAPALTQDGLDPAAVRAWGREHGYEIRGSLSKVLIAAYRAAHPEDAA